MNDLISRQEAINKILEYFIEYHGGAFREDDQRALIEVFEKIPIVDAVPVIRCKDCKFLRLTGTVWKCQNRLVMMLCEPNDYCSRAERKEK